MRKSYAIDTNVLLDDPRCIEKLLDAGENEVVIPLSVLLELDSLKKTPRLRRQVAAAVEEIAAHRDRIDFPSSRNNTPLRANCADLHILDDLQSNGFGGTTELVTNDVIFRIVAETLGVDAVAYTNSRPVQSESEAFTGIVEEDECGKFPNSFFWKDGTPFFCGKDGVRPLGYKNTPWKVEPRSPYQNMMLDLALNPDVDLLSVQSEAGFGKTFLALASAFKLALQDKAFRKIVVVKPLIEVGAKLGYLPGDVDEKIAPFNRYVADLVLKLHEKRTANAIFLDADRNPPAFDPRRFELMPITFMRGMNIEDAVVIIDECQNLSREEMRTVLSRLGENVKCICLGDVRQVDNPNLDSMNNGLSWLVEKCKGASNYAHMVLKGTKSRGPICDLIRKVGL